VIRTAVFARAELRGDLTDAERAVMPRGARAAEWTAGRLAVHRVLGEPRDVLVAGDGAPRVEGAEVSLSHDGGWVAVAVGDEGRAVAIDLCAAEHAERVAGVLERLGVAAGSPDACVVWAALECALKLRRLGVWALVDAKLAVDVREGGANVRGIGDEVAVAWRRDPEYVVAWAEAA
jgi:hypothetical protein